VRLVVGSNSEIFWPVPRRGDAGVAGSTSRSRNDGSGQKSRNDEYELTAGEAKMAQVVAVCISEKKGERKTQVSEVQVRENHGVVGDAHAGEWHRQVSLLAEESIAKMQALGLDVHAGDFAENITTSGIELVALPVGSRLRVGETLLEVTQIGKECHTRCAIYYQAGDCVMPKEGIFAKVITGGTIRPGDLVQRMD
jgi:MOSC domain-containing protein YiiM